MRILIVNFEYPPLGGGGGVATKQLAEELGIRHEVHVVTTLLAGLKSDEKVGGVHIHRVKVWGRRELPTATIISLLTFLPTSLWLAWRLSGRIKFDVINAQFVLPSGLPAMVIAEVRRIPFVLSFVGGDLYDPTKGISPHRHSLMRWMIRRVSERATICTAISEDTKRRAREIHGVRKKILVTHLGIVPSQVSAVDRTSLGWPKEELVFITIGRLIPRKGFAELLAVWREIPKFHLVIMGRGCLAGDLKAMVTEAGLRERVHFVGFVEEEQKKVMLATADAYVSAAIHEGFGIVFLEAMEAGLPIVTTNSGGQTDFLTDGKNALLVPPGDAELLKQAIIALGSDRGLRKAMSLQNKVDVKNYHLTKTARRFEQVLMKVVETTEHK